MFRVKPGRVVALVVVAVVVASAFGVAAGAPVDVAKFKKAPPYVIALCNMSVVNAWRVAMVEEFKAAAASSPLISKVEITDAGGQIQKQIADMEDLIAKKVDAILITAQSPSALSPAVEKAVRAGIPVIAFDNVVDTPVTTVKVIADQQELGASMARWLVQELGGKGKVFALGGVAGAPAAVQRWEGASREFKKAPGIQVIGPNWVNWAYDKAKQTAENLLAAHPDVAGIWTDGGGSAQGALEVVLASGRVIPVTGTASNGFVKMWAQAKPKGFKSYSATAIPGDVLVALDIALNILQGKPTENIVYSPLAIVDNSNVEKLARFDLSDEFWVHCTLPEEIITKLWGKK